jgi:hypothetical protein
VIWNTSACPIARHRLLAGGWLSTRPTWEKPWPPSPSDAPKDAEMSNSPLVGGRSPRKGGFLGHAEQDLLSLSELGCFGNTHQGILRGRQRHSPSPHCLWDLTGPHWPETKALPTERARAAHRRTRRHLYRSSLLTKKGGSYNYPCHLTCYPENWAIIPHTFPFSAMV